MKVYVVLKSGGYDENTLNDTSILAVCKERSLAVEFVTNLTKTGKFIQTSESAWYETLTHCPAYGWCWCCYNIEEWEVQ